VLTRGSDSSQGLVSGATPQWFEGGRYLIELSPQQGNPCPAPTGTFTIAPSGSSPRAATTSLPVNVAAGQAVSFDACPPPTAGNPTCPATGPIGISNLGAAVASYQWSFCPVGQSGSACPTDTITSTVQPVAADFGFTWFVWPSPTDTHVFHNPGTFTVTLTMEGDFGTYVESGTINVGGGSGLLPTASFAYAQAATPPLTMTVDASASKPATGGQIIDYHWDWGDGQIDDAPTPIDSHTYPAPGIYTVTLSLLDRGCTPGPTPTCSYARGKPVSAKVRITAPTPPPSTTTRKPPAIKPGPPRVRARVVSTRVRHGRVSLILSCPSGQTLCSGTALLKTATPVAVPLPGGRPAHARRGRQRAHKAVLVLGSARFRVAGGARHRVTIRLTSDAMALLSKSRRLRTVATIIAKNPQGSRAVTTYKVTLRLPRQPLSRRGSHGRHAR
jgi:hypothetical protein